MPFEVLPVMTFGPEVCNSPGRTASSWSVRTMTSSSSALFLRDARAPATVHLWPDESDWSCDCSATLRPCIHIAAASIALPARRESGEGLPTGDGQAGVARVGYRFTRTNSRSLAARRRRWCRRGPPEGAVSGNHHGPSRLSFVDADTDAELAVARRWGSRAQGASAPSVRALSDVADVQLDGEPVTVGENPVVPHGWVEDHGGSFRLRIVRDPAVKEVFGNGIVRCGTELRYIGDGDLSREQRRILTRGIVFSVDEVGQLVGDMIPRLEQKIPVHVRTKRLPNVDASPPRLVLETKKQGDTLITRPVIIYGDPPSARITRGELEIMGDTVPIRSERSEQRLIRQLGEELRMALGVESRLQGMAAVRFVDRLDRFSGEITGVGIKHFRRVGPIEPEIQIDGDKVHADMGGANPDDVVAAWVAGDELVSLPTGGWAPLPLDWLERYGDRLADLAAARPPRTGCPPCALRSCAAVRGTGPSAARRLAGVRALVDDFDGIPDAPLPDDFLGELRSYQQTGINWLTFLRKAEMGGVLADDMGLGKTIQALCMIERRRWWSLHAVCSWQLGE